MQIICRKDLLAQHLQTIRQLCPNHLKEFCNLGEKPMGEKGVQPDVGLLVKKFEPVQVKVMNMRVVKFNQN